MNRHYILNGKETKLVGLMEWAKWSATADRYVAETAVSDEIIVSTVFLGTNYRLGEGPPVLFETMIFGGEHDEYCERYETWEQAEKGHKVACSLATPVLDY